MCFYKGSNSRSQSLSIFPVSQTQTETLCLICVFLGFVSTIVFTLFLVSSIDHINTLYCISFSDIRNDLSVEVNIVFYLNPTGVALPGCLYYFGELV